MVLERGDDVSWLSLRNLDLLHVLTADQLNTYDVLCADDIVFTKGALDAFLAPRGVTEAAEENAK